MLPSLRKSNYQNQNQIIHEPRQDAEQVPPKSHRSSQMKKILRNSGDKKHHHHYPGSTPLNDNFSLDKPSASKNFEYSFDNGKQECQARLIPPKVSKHPRKWRNLLQKRPSNQYCHLAMLELNSDSIDEAIMKQGIMVFSSDSGDNKKTKEEREEEQRMRQEQKEKEKELEEIQKSREIAMKELEMKRAMEAEKEAKIEMEEERKLREKQLQILRENAIIGEDPYVEEKVETVESKIQKSKKKK